jgi:YfiH family protein
VAGAGPASARAKLFNWHARDGRVRWAFTGRHGGVSTGPYASLNLGAHVGDEPVAVDANRAILAEAVGLPREHVRYMDQCHGSDVAVMDAATSGAQPPRVDALVTTSAGLALAVLVADCVPVLLADPSGGVVAAVHAGRKGMVAGVVHRALAVMREHGARDVVAVVGPSVCSRCYEVPEEMQAAAASVAPESAALSWTGTPAIDVAAGVVAQLRAEGVSVTWVPGCTRESPALFSHRRDGQTGRFAGVVALSPS